MRARQRKKLRGKTDRYIEYRQSHGLPVILDESAKFSKKGRRLLRAMAVTRALLGESDFMTIARKAIAEDFNRRFFNLGNFEIADCFGDKQSVLEYIKAKNGVLS